MLYVMDGMKYPVNLHMYIRIIPLFDTVSQPSTLQGIISDWAIIWSETHCFTDCPFDFFSGGEQPLLCTQRVYITGQRKKGIYTMPERSDFWCRFPHDFSLYSRSSLSKNAKCVLQIRFWISSSIHSWFCRRPQIVWLNRKGANVMWCT